MSLAWADFKDDYFLPGEQAVAERIPYHCIVCADIIQDAWASRCGHVVCEGCLSKSIVTNVILEKTCFLCHGKEPNWARAFNVNFQIKALKIRCPRAPACKWEGTLGDFLEHCNTKCELRQVECKNFGCGVRYVACESKQHDHWCRHEREVQCPKCMVAMHFDELEDTHPGECEAAEIECGKCKQKTERRQLVYHASYLCPEELISCGKCSDGKTFARKDTAKHKEVCLAEEMMCLCGQMILRRDKETHRVDPEFALRHLDIATLTARKERERAEEAEMKLRALQREMKQLKDKKRAREPEPEAEEDASSGGSHDENTHSLKTAETGLLFVNVLAAVIIAPILCHYWARFIHAWLLSE
jgi:hypothetical protein